MNPRVFVTGYGIISSIGGNAQENLTSLTQQRSGFGPLTILDTVHHQSLPCCEIKRTDNDLAEAAGIKRRHGFTRTSLLGLIALQEALAAASLTSSEIAESGLISATTTGGIREFETRFYQIGDLTRSGEFTQFNDTANPGEHSERLAETVGIRKHIATLSTACSSSANAIMLGAQMIRQGKCVRVICGGAEALSKFTINGFNTLMILDPTHCRPFDATRKGLNLGEGAAYVVLESSESIASSKKVLAEVSGYGNANDAFHQTASSPDGNGAFLAMRHALAVGTVKPQSIDYINAHGTATENNDLSEGIALQRLFDPVPSFSSTKPNVGHTLAAAGSIEAAFCLMALQHQVVWPNLNFREAMPELRVTPVTTQSAAKLKHVLSNSFGFGGNTTSLLFSQV